MRVHELLSQTEQKDFWEHYARVKKRVGRKLPPELLYAHAATTFVLGKHSENDPKKPEYPPWRPRFPATTMRQVSIPGCENFNVFVKDESTNPISGTHKDRMMWEAAKKLAGTLNEIVAQGKNGGLPRYSLITSGNAGLALGRMMELFGFPAMHVLLDRNTDERTIEQLRDTNLIVHTANLSRKKSSDQVLKLTKNEDGINLTNGGFAREISRIYYDWLSYEILNHAPNYVVVPYGTGDLYDNLLHYYVSEMGRMTGSDPRLLASKRNLHGMHLIGVTAQKGSPARMLVAPHRPGSTLEEAQKSNAHEIEQHVRSKLLGEQSGIHYLDDKQLFEARRVAARIGLNAEYSALAGLAWLLKNKKTIPRGSRVVIVSTGKGVVED